MENNLVSTIIPVFNRPELLLESINSVLAQSHRPIQIIVVDDGSTDDTVALVDRLASDYEEIEVIHIENSGPGPAREAGRQFVRGEFIQYLDSDDLLLPKKFEVQVAALNDSPECGVCYGKTVYSRHGEKYREIPWKRTGEKIETMFPSFIEDRWWGTSTPLYRKTACDQIGPWKPIRNEDWEYDCRIAAMGTRLSFCEEFVSHERGPGGTRQSENASSDPVKLAGRAATRQLIWKTAVQAGLKKTIPEVEHFARYAFLLARQCGQAGLRRESSELFELAREASTEDKAQGLDFVLYGFTAKVFGWTAPAKLSAIIDQYLRKR